MLERSSEIALLLIRCQGGGTALRRLQTEITAVRQNAPGDIYNRS
jgi:hypothetical protein